MKCFWCLFITFFSLHALGFSYELETASLLNPSISQRYELAQIFAGKGYRSISDMSLSKLGLPFDGVYTSPDWKQSLLLKAGLKAPASIEGRIIEEPSLGMLIFHFKFNGTPYLLAAQNLSKAEFSKIVRPWLSASKSSVLFSLAVPKVEAFDCSFAQSKFDAFVNTQEFIQAQDTLQTIGKCATDAFAGAKQSATSTIEFFEKLTMDPRALWGEMKESFAELKDFVFNINTEMKSALDNFSGLDPKERSQLVCTMTGELIMGALQGMASAAGLAKLLPALLLKLKAATATLAKLANLEKTGIKLPNKSLLAKEALSCVR